MDNIFKKGDRVFSIQYGFGIVIENNLEGSDYPLRVDFDESEKDIGFTNDGKWHEDEPKPTLSFTKYTLNGFSQERPVNYDDWVGKWCKFWDRYHVDAYVIRKFKTKSNFAKFEDSIGVPWDNCEPLSELAIKELGL